VRFGQHEEFLSAKPKKSRLADGEEKARKICEALRAQNVEAYEFHDRHQSIVTVGSFDWVSQKNGAVNPAVQRVIDHFKAKEVQIPGAAAPGLTPARIAGVMLDVEPLPVEIPKQSVSRAMAREP
jgi:hypothetical protein